MTDYPISEKLFEKYMYFIIKNIDYEENKVILEILLVLTEKLPQNIIDHYVLFTNLF